jgi:glycoprotein 6-alpha-L-fucosyltransferase
LKLQHIQICRGAYEWKQTLHPDAADRIHSLDDVYFFAGQGSHDRVVVMDHIALKPDEIDLQVGDKVGVAGNHWDGYSLVKIITQSLLF